MLVEIYKSAQNVMLITIFVCFVEKILELAVIRLLFWLVLTF